MEPENQVRGQLMDEVDEQDDQVSQGQQEGRRDGSGAVETAADDLGLEDRVRNLMSEASASES